MRFRVFSDIHQDAWLKHRLPLWAPDPLPEDAETVLVLAGDIWNGLRPLKWGQTRWLAELSERFLHIILVLGNHDYWDERLDTFAATFQGTLQEQGLSERVTLLDAGTPGVPGAVTVAGVCWVGATLWTDLASDPLAAMDFNITRGHRGFLWGDRQYIRRAGYCRVEAAHITQAHRRAVLGLQQALDQAESPVVLVTHHAPLLRASRFGSKDAAMFGTDLSYSLLGHPAIKAVVYGHTHVPVLDQELPWLLINNPVGYPAEGLSPRQEAFILAA